MKINKLLDYKFAIDFLENRTKFNRFRAGLVRALDDEKFRRKTEIMDIDNADKIAAALIRMRPKNPSRRTFIKTAGIAAAGVVAFGEKVLAQESPKRLYEEMQKIPELRSEDIPYFSDEPDAKTITRKSAEFRKQAPTSLEV